MTKKPDGVGKPPAGMAQDAERTGEGAVHLSRRLAAIADMVTPGSVICDVGCDHAYIPIRLIQDGIIPRAIAMDVAEGPLNIAAQHIAQHCSPQQASRILLRQSDGLGAYSTGEADTLIIAGMGGPLIARILGEPSPDPEMTPVRLDACTDNAAENEILAKARSFREIILEPQSEVTWLRSWLRVQGFQFLDETMVFEDGKYYPVMKLAGEAEGCFSEMSPELADRFGPVNLRKREEIFLQYLTWSRHLAEGILRQLPEESADPRIAARRNDLEHELEAIRAAQDYSAT